MQNQNKKKFARILYLLKMLSDGGLNVAEAAYDSGVSVLTIQRDLETIQEAGFPIYPSKRGYFVFVEGFSLNKTQLSDKEASLFVLFCFQKLRKLWGRPFSSHSREFKRNY